MGRPNETTGFRLFRAVGPTLVLGTVVAPTALAAGGAEPGALLASDTASAADTVEVTTSLTVASDGQVLDEVSGPTWTQGMWVDRTARRVTLQAVVQAEAFRRSLPPDHQYHALVSREGSAASKALFVTNASDSALARVMREMGAADGGGVPMAAWNLRWVPLVSAPTSRVAGSRIQVRITWDGAGAEYDLAELLDDPAGHGVELRFGGNEDHRDEWHSGCILCLFSCPSGVISNAAYTIRDHQRAVTAFEPNDRLPPDGTQVTITLALVPD